MKKLERGLPPDVENDEERDAEGERDSDNKLSAILTPSALLRDLHTGGERAAQATMRLHRPHYHAPASELKLLLQRAGVADAVISAVEDVVKACTACRGWSGVAPKPLARLRLPNFNDVLLVDIFFFNFTEEGGGMNQVSFLLMVDEATRFRLLAPIAGKDKIGRLCIPE